MCQLALWWRSCMAWGSIWGKTGWSRCQIKNHIFKGHLGVGVGACVGLTVFGCVCMCLLCVCVFARCLGSTRRLQTRSWPIPSGYILIYQDDFKSLNILCWPWISIFKKILCLKTWCWCRLQDGCSLYLPPTLGRDTSAYWDRVNLLKTHFEIFHPLVWNIKVEQNIILSWNPSDLIQTFKRCQIWNINISY